MDAFADAGYLVLGLDYFRGDPVWKHRRDRLDRSNPDFDYEAWKRKHMAFADEAVPRWVDEVKRTYGQPSTREARQVALDILESGKKTYQLQLFSSVSHGFALRGNMKDPYERYVKEQSLRGIIEWFDFWLSQ
ncbi:hypothetical protein APSETT444_005787 [Aspergillus pseudonomiae]